MLKPNYSNCDIRKQIYNIFLIFSIIVFTSCQTNEKIKVIKLKPKKTAITKKVVKPSEKPIKVSKDFDPEGYKSIEKLIMIMHILRSQYVDEKKISYDKLINGALRGMLYSLDPYSVYEGGERYKGTVKSVKGEFCGIGIIVSTKNKVLEIISPMDDSPAFKAGVHAGDIITGINDKDISSMSMHECIDKLKGEAGTKITIKVYRKKEDKSLDFTITRKILTISPVKGINVVAGDIGYIRLTQFSSPTTRKMLLALEELVKEKKVKGLIFDLRWNPGGLLQEAIKVCSLFLDEKKLVLTTEGREDKHQKSYYSLKCDKYTEIPIVILINSFSASASEIVAGCLQDHNRAVILGETSFGKGSVQSMLQIAEDAAIRFTTSKYYTPSHKIIHEHGVEPDILVDISEKDERQLVYQITNYPGQIKPDEKDAIEDIQLKRAVSILKGLQILKSKK